MRARSWLALLLMLTLLAGLVPAAMAADGVTDCNHSFQKHTTATCEEWGLTTYYCPKCGYGYEERTPPLGHDYGPPQPDIPATCTEPGRDVRVCRRNPHHIWYIEVPALGHDWGEWTVVVPPTTTSEGLEQRVCARDPSHVEERAIPKLEPSGPQLTLTLVSVSPNLPAYPENSSVHMETRIENTGSIPLTNVYVQYYDSEGLVYGNGSTMDLAPGEGFNDTWIHTFDSRDVGLESFTFLWQGYGMAQTSALFPTGTMGSDGNDIISGLEATPAAGEGIVKSNEVAFPVRVLNRDFAEATLTAVEGSGAGAKIGDWVTADITVTNTGAVAWKHQNSHVISSAAGVQYKWGDSTSYMGTEFQPTQGFSYQLGILVTPDDAASHAVIRTVEDMEIRSDTGATVNSNQARIVIPLDEDIEVPEDKVPNLSLSVLCTDPEPFYFDADGKTPEIHYVLTVTNTGKAECLDVNHVIINGSDVTTAVAPASLLPGEHKTLSASYVFTDAMLGTDGKLPIAFQVYGYFEDIQVFSNIVELKHPTDVQPPFELDENEVTIVKEEVGSSLSPNGYAEGEQVRYKLTITNHLDVEIPSVTLTDDHQADSMDLYNLQPHESRVLEYTYTVVKTPDVDDGVIINTAAVSWTSPLYGIPMSSSDSELVYTTGTPQPVVYGVFLDKSADTSTMDVCFKPGEPITYTVYVKNTSDRALYNVNVTDPMASPSLLAHYDMMPVGAEDWLHFTYTVTDPDADAGAITNTATIIGYDEDGNAYAYSDDCTVPTGHPVPPRSSSVFIFKEEISAPLDLINGYDLNEPIDYKITVTNDGELPVTNVRVYDLDGGKILLGTIAIMHPEESYLYYYTHIVNTNDQGHHEAVNQAMAVFNTRTAQDVPRLSNIVRSPVKGNPPPDDPGSGKEVSCITTLIGKGDVLAKYELDPCPEHGEIAEQMEEILDAAETDEQLAAAWEQVIALWQTSLDELYERYSKATGGELSAAIVADSAYFNHYYKTMEQFLPILFPDDPVSVGQFKAEMLMRQVAELCYLEGYAPETPRPDSLLNGTCKGMSASNAFDCCEQLMSLNVENGNYVISQWLCTEHVVPETSILTMLHRSTTRAEFADVFNRGLRQWRAYLDKDTKARFAAMDTDGRAVLVQQRRAFDEWILARKTLLDLLYPSSPATVAEVLCEIEREQVLLLCGK